MSHFTVLVIGDDPEAQLAPYHEFECTGIDDQYVQDIDITEEVRDQIHRYVSQDNKPVPEAVAEALQYYGHEPDNFLSDEYDADLKGRHKYGWAVVQRHPVTGVLTGIIKVVRRTNPNAKWDWYVLGGRWRGFFKLKRTGALGALGKPGVFDNDPNHDADQALKRDIDFWGMRYAAAREATVRWNRVNDLVGIPDANTRPWGQFMNEERLGTMDERRAAYWAQPGLVRLQDARKRKDLDKDDTSLLVWLDYDDYNVPREVYVEGARDTALATFAMVKDGHWYERGGMGWFGFVSDEKDPSAWAREFSELLDAVPDDTLLSLFDCHI